MLKFFPALVLLALAASPARAEWPAESVAMGARDHPKLLQRFGGEVQNPPLSAYVSAVGARVVAASDRADETWRFTVLDSPAVNAFALPGGYIYVTRGLLALANSESQLAAVLAHEVTHVLEYHVEARQAAQSDALVEGALSALVTGLFGGGEDRLGSAVRSGVETTLGQIGSYSQEQEFAADAGGITLLQAAGYRPAAQAEFLAAMAANTALAGQRARGLPEFADHPAPEERQLRALALAGSADGERGVEPYLAAIEGMKFGQNQRGGIIRGQVFLHPQLGFQFEAAAGLRIQNAARQINILGPGRATLVMTGGTGTSDLLGSLQAWAAQVPRAERQGRDLSNMQRLEINGMEAATGTVNLRQRGRRTTLRLTVIRFNGGLIRFAGTTPRGDEAAAGLQWQTVQSFGPLVADPATLAQHYLAIHYVAAGEPVEALVPEGMSAAEFRVLNQLGPQQELQVGRAVKTVSF